MDGTGSGSCPIAGFGTSVVQLSGCEDGRWIKYIRIVWEILLLLIYLSFMQQRKNLIPWPLLSLEFSVHYASTLWRTPFPLFLMALS
jgi:hypothetical protein